MHENHIIIRLYNLAGEVLGQLTLPSSFRLIDLEPLKALGAVKMEVSR